ncbi:MAG: ATPase, partial [Rhodospirillales bacterium]|nr:ATPase [Rhodospirillales bacterium]
YDAPLAVTSGIAACSQPEASLAALERRLAGFDDGRLAALAVAVEATGSLVVGLALVAGRLDAVGAFAAAELDATYQIEKWGEDAEATQRRAGVRADLDAAARFLALYGAT